MRPTKERRSDATRIRQMRRLLNNALVGFRMLEDGPAPTSPEHPRAWEWNAHVRDYARDMVRIIRRELEPKRRAASERGERTR